MRASADDEYVEYVTARLPDLRRLGALLCGDGHRADDLVQQTITKLYVGWARIRTVDNLDSYVRTMLTNTFLSERRSPWARVRLFSKGPDPEVAPSPPGSYPAAVEEREVVAAALAKLPCRQRAVLVLRFMCDLSVAEVAATLRCSEGTVKSHTHRGLAALRQLLDTPAFTPCGRV
ncbi:SigE family RNA polymerase sigma factor [Planosporangium thailandense]|uniref:SigE family RNA polymerase sigma factor n=1 Tax=Planosporangium thailandense TaxID=765197 RepID=A0ABX0XZ26_9ACTN|nr:SigE family RNA polymerase sigma factor [Planosporangium thailandense]NJC70615.1 SigE family RNA polymerase sigma factor [Planosporangium thailandense]